MERLSWVGSEIGAADVAVAAIRIPEELAAKQAAWRTWWLDALGGMPMRTPLNARVVGRAEFDGFRLENIIFESQPGVYVTAQHSVRPWGRASWMHCALESDCCSQIANDTIVQLLTTND